MKKKAKVKQPDLKEMPESGIVVVYSPKGKIHILGESLEEIRAIKADKVGETVLIDCSVTIPNGPTCCPDDVILPGEKAVGAFRSHDGFRFFGEGAESVNMQLNNNRIFINASVKLKR